MSFTSIVKPRRNQPLSVADVVRLIQNARARGALDDDVVTGITGRSWFRLSSLTVHHAARDGDDGIVLPTR